MFNLFHSVVVLLNNQTPPQGYTKIDVNLNSIVRGDAIHVWYKTTPSNPDILKDAVQELAIEYGKDVVTPFGWNKINADLNSAKDGKEGFGEPTWLYMKKGHKGNIHKQCILMYNEFSFTCAYIIRRFTRYGTFDVQW